MMVSCVYITVAVVCVLIMVLLVQMPQPLPRLGITFSFNCEICETPNTHVLPTLQEPSEAKSLLECESPCREGTETHDYDPHYHRVVELAPPLNDYPLGHPYNFGSVLAALLGIGLPLRIPLCCVVQM